MTRYLNRMVLSVAVFMAMAFSAQVANAFVVRGWDGYFYGNVCRNGAYFQIVPYQLTNSYCFMPAWNSWGVITWE